ncbi:hypothetical protein BSKO_03897 [Bryopsis sp. KO-2023]|nr:hypothetical protein BSKO_03897 [Bryopsis sp. KO-2023]
MVLRPPWILEAAQMEDCFRTEGRVVIEKKQREFCLHGAAQPEFVGNGVAVQFLDYPVFYLPIKGTTGDAEAGKRIETYGCGKRCVLEGNVKETQMLMNQVPLFLMHINAKSNGKVCILSTGSVPTVLHVPNKTNVSHLDKEGFKTCLVAMTDASQKQVSTASLCVRISVIAPLQAATEKLCSGAKQSWKEVASKSQTQPRVGDSGKDSIARAQPFMERFVGRLEELRSKPSEKQGLGGNVGHGVGKTGDWHHCPGCCFTVPTKAAKTQPCGHGATRGDGKASCSKKQGSRKPPMGKAASRQLHPAIKRKGKPCTGQYRASLGPPTCHASRKRAIQRPAHGNTRSFIKRRSQQTSKVKHSRPLLSCVPENQEQNFDEGLSACPHCGEHFSRRSKGTVQDTESNSESNPSDGSQHVDMGKENSPQTHQPNLTKKQGTRDKPKTLGSGVENGLSMCTATLWELINLISMRTVLSQAVTTMGNQMTLFANQTMQQLATGLLPVAGEQPSVIATLGAMISQQVMKEMSETTMTAPAGAPSKIPEKVTPQQTNMESQKLGEGDMLVRCQSDRRVNSSPEPVESEPKPANHPTHGSIASPPTSPVSPLKKSVSFPEEATVVDLHQHCSPRVGKMQVNSGLCDQLGTQVLSPKSRQSVKNVNEWRVLFDGGQTEALHAKETTMGNDGIAAAPQLEQAPVIAKPILQADRQKSLATSVSSIHSEIYEEDFEASCPETPRSKQSRTSTLSTRAKEKIVTSRTPSGILLGEILSGSSCSSDGSGHGLEAQPSTLRSVSTRMSEIYEDDFEQEAASEVDTDPSDRQGQKRNQEKPYRDDATSSSTHSSDFLSINDSLDINDLLGDTDFLRNQSSH